MAIAVPIPGATFRNDAPVVYDDARLALGTLMLIDPASSIDTLSAVPASGGRVPNIAQDICRNILGNDTAEVRASLQYSNWTSDLGLVELTAKGGFHGIVDNPIDTTNAKGFDLQLPTTISAYLFANPAHAYYVSLWGQVTRASGETTDAARMPFSIVCDPTNQTGKYMYFLKAGLTRPNVAPALTAATGSPIADAIGAYRASIGIGAVTGSPSTLSSARIASWGNTGTSGFTTKPASWVLYSYLLEDLTVSGRTYADAEEADVSQYMRLVTAVTGRYHGDTWTDPTTV